MVSIHCVRIFDKIIIIKCLTAQPYFSNTFFLLPLFPSTAVWFYDVKSANVFDKCYKCFTCNLLISHRNKWVINERKKNSGNIGSLLNRKWHRKIMSNVMRMPHRCLKMRKKAFRFSRAHEMIWATVWATLDQANKLHCITLNIKYNLQPRCVLPKCTYAKPSYWNSKNEERDRERKKTNVSKNKWAHARGRAKMWRKFIGSGICFDNNLLSLLWFRFTMQSANYGANLILFPYIWPEKQRNEARCALFKFVPL